MAQPKTAKPTSINVSDFLKTKTNAEKSKKKSTVPELGTYSHLTDKVVEAKKNYQDAEAVFTSLEGELIEHIRKEYEDAANGGDFSKSFNVIGKTTAGVQVTFTDRFSDVAEDVIDSLRDVTEPSQIKTFFEEKRVLTLAKTDDDTIKMLVEKLGEQTFGDIFKIKVSLAAKKDMDRNQFELVPEARGLLKQAKPGVKLLKED
jgi:hypothetical protein